MFVSDNFLDLLNNPTSYEDEIIREVLIILAENAEEILSKINY